jgi:hypothetical protein
MSQEIADRVFNRFALSNGKKEEVVKKVVKKLKKKKDNNENKDNKEKVEGDLSEDTQDESSGSNLDEMADKLQKDMEDMRADGKVEREEFLRMFEKMMDMVESLVNAKPPPKKRKGTRGTQVKRKDKDLMSDTGGISKGREREPTGKPPREDMRNRYKPKKRKPENLDKDTDRDPDKKGSVHPLDRKVEMSVGVMGPEENVAFIQDWRWTDE